MPNHAGWRAIKEVSEDLSLPSSFREDMYGDEPYQDKKRLKGPKAPLIFGWSLRNSGTDMYCDVTDGSISWAQTGMRNGFSNYLWFIFNGEVLNQVSPDKFIAFLKIIKGDRITTKEQVEAIKPKIDTLLKIDDSYIEEYLEELKSE